MNYGITELRNYGIRKSESVQEPQEAPGHIGPQEAPGHIGPGKPQDPQGSHRTHSDPWYVDPDSVIP